VGAAVGADRPIEGYTLAQRLSSEYQTLVISPRSYFVFTPLLNSTSVGTLEFRTALEPVRSRQKPNIEFIQGWGDDVDFAHKTVTVEENVVDQRQGKAQTEDRYEDHTVGQKRTAQNTMRKEGKRFEVPYDKLVITVGCYSQTFGTPGVKENAYFQKDVGDARRIRKRILECFETASLPSTSDKLREQLLRFAVVGGGPTGMEFAAELRDLVHEDLSKLYPELVPKVRIAVLDVAPKVLSMFDDKLGKYAMDAFRREGVEVKTSHHVKELRPGLPRSEGEEGMDEVQDSQGCYTLNTEEEGDIGIGMCVWSTGLMMNPFIEKALSKSYNLPSTCTVADSAHKDQEWTIEKNPKTGALIVDEKLRVQLVSQSTTSSSSSKEESQQGEYPTATTPLSDVFALGDNANIRSTQLPATAQTASQQAIWLGRRLNKNDLEQKSFSFTNMGVMAYLGDKKSIVQTGGPFGNISGWVAWLIWRGAYLTKSVSWRNKILIPTYWFLNWAFGRDITRF